jgi:aerobic carbon-monoxide dehydrogenase small subunit
MSRVKLTINGKKIEADIPPRLHLADFLREELLLTGTHIGCEHGVCGACTVEIDGDIARSCITYAVACDGSTVRTIEGFDDDALMQKLRQAFSAEHALQCGYCTPGMLIAARDLLQRKSGLDRASIRHEMSGNLCRCTGYTGIINAIARLAEDTTALPRQPTTRLGTAPSVPPEAADEAAASASTPAHASSPTSASRPQARQWSEPLPLRERPARQNITIIVEPIAMDMGTTRLRQRFTIEHPREKVWEVLRDPAKVAALIPGVILDTLGDAVVTGRMALRLGPIKATFTGSGTVDRSDRDFRQVISGRGDDRSGGSIAEGQIDCALQEVAATATAATEVEINLSYSLRGPLAQFGRSNLIRDFVTQIGEQFANNLNGVLSDERAPIATSAEFAPLPLLWKTFLRAISAQLWRLFRQQE